MIIGKLYNHDPRHFRFERRCDGFYVDRSPDSHWLIAGPVVGALILLALFVVVAK